MKDGKDDVEVAPWEDLPTGGDMNAMDEENTDENSNDTIDSTDTINSNDNNLEEVSIPPEKVPLIDEIASEYVGFWNRLVSQTNWEKGKVILTWRNRLMETGVPRNVYSDDSLAKRIGNVSGQHVGRLRRVYEQFGEMEKYKNLYWSHYQAALDWDDATDWLQKADTEGLSVASMRIARWEKYGAPVGQKPKENEIVVSEQDEDVNPYNDSDSSFIDFGVPPITSSDDENENGGGGGKKQDPDREKNSKKKENSEDTKAVDLQGFEGSEEEWKSQGQLTSDVLNTLKKLDPLPEDLGDAFEMLKIAILNHKLTNWAEVSAETLLKYIQAMRALILSKEK